MAEEENKIILYTTDDGKSRVSLMSRDGQIGICSDDGEEKCGKK